LLLALATAAAAAATCFSAARVAESVALCRHMATLHPLFTPSQQADFEASGFVSLGQVVPPSLLQAMRDRLDALMLGDVAHEGMSFQLDLGVGSDGVASMAETTVGLSEPSLAHRRVNDLELDEVFGDYIRLELFEAIAAHYYRGAEAVSVFRAFMMNKPPEQGTPLGWHQDVGEGWGIDSLPVMTVWMALDAATVESGAMQLVCGSHRRGVISAGHFADEGTMAQFHEEDIVDLECEVRNRIFRAILQ
jgi:hypothetical protein